MKKMSIWVLLLGTIEVWAQPAFLDTVDVAGGFTSPVDVTHAGDGSNRLFVVEQGGRIKVVDADNNHLATPFLDISTIITSGGESGLLGLAFHPQYASNGYFYVNYTDLAGDTVIARYSVSAADVNVADPASAHPVLSFDQPFGPHNGGDLNFGPNDGYLYISSGDGGGDPMASQDPSSLLGKILRIDVNGDDFPGDVNRNFAIPPDNPNVGNPGADAVWLSGFRNPWRFSFDRQTGDLYIGDVGEDAWEEFNYLAADAPGGGNYGWPCFEGSDVFSTNKSCGDASGYEFPITALAHDQPGSNFCTAVGGYVYRGSEFGGLNGWYLYTDWCDGRFFAARPSGGGWETHDMGTLVGGFAVTGMGENEAGELFLVAWSGLLQITGPDDLIFSATFE